MFIEISLLYLGESVDIEKSMQKINSETDINLCVSFFHYYHMPSVALVKDERLNP